MKVYTCFSLVRLNVEKFAIVVEQILNGEQMYKRRDGTILNGEKYDRD